ncbi:OmpA family protein [Neisseria chenwenguii]|uniref:Uncharacterized protein n=1 Tax=Neisseria chenwenguii TaxID=1853278 RepID=A0A220S0F7_9NEIS|nr:OmpA family protein [Neisseria chenwenguii]ASK26970.1 hypothetical protein BG910_03750 [Neisseria chenwenguii]ROV56128.1 OmpA family protein [Neisseria chenwenguii]
MSDQDDNKEQRIGLWLVGAAVGLAAAATLFFSVWGWETGKIEGLSNNGGAETAVAAEASAAASEAAVVEAMSAEAAAASAASAGALETVAPADVSPVEASAAGASAAVGDNAAVVVENGVVKFYFASGKAELAEGAQEALKDVLAGVKAGKKAVVSGFHDKTGNQAVNKELSKKRAMAVKNALMGFGVEEAQIELRKPTDSEGSGADAAARRVEVVLE